LVTLRSRIFAEGKVSQNGGGPGESLGDGARWRCPAPRQRPIRRYVHRVRHGEALEGSGSACELVPRRDGRGQRSEEITKEWATQGEQTATTNVRHNLHAPPSLAERTAPAIRERDFRDEERRGGGGGPAASTGEEALEQNSASFIPLRPLGARTTLSDDGVGGCWRWWSRTFTAPVVGAPVAVAGVRGGSGGNARPHR
jgi:hypothetical protein